jgi:hypothetical protein
MSAQAAAAAAAAATATGVRRLIAEPSPLGRRLVTAVNELGWDEAFDVITDFVEAAPSRRRLTLLDAGGNLRDHVKHFREAVALLIDMTMNGYTTAELLLLYLPRVFACKGLSYEESLEVFEKRGRPIPRTKRVDAMVGWARAVHAAAEERPVQTMLERLDAIPEAGAAPQQRSEPARPLAERLEELHPVQPLHQELARWRDRIAGVAGEARFTSRDMLRWAHASAKASGGETGWTGHLVRHLLSTGHELFDAFCAWAARPPGRWAHTKNTAIATRMLTGWLIPRPGKSPRPIAAPSFIRRVGSRALVKRAKSLAERFCVMRGQLGLSGEPESVAYTALANMALRQGGKIACDDLSSSYTRFTRRAVLEAVEALTATAQSDEDSDAVRALHMAMADYYIADDGYDAANPTTLPISMVNFQEVDNMLPIFGLAQGCTLSGLLESVSIAHHTPHGPKPQGPLTLGNHDDLIRMAGPRDPLPNRPDVTVFGGEYSATKEAGLSAHDAQSKSITAWGRPLGNIDTWMSAKLEVATARLDKIRKLAEVAPAAAVAAVMRLGGPHGLLLHALKGVPPDEYKEVWLLTLEHRWADMIVDILGPRDGQWDNAEHRRRRVCEGNSPFAGSRKAAQLACLTGLALAVQGTERLLGCEWAKTLATTLAGKHLQRSGVQNTPAAIRTYVAEAHDQVRRHPPPRTLWRLALGRTGDLARVLDDTARGSDGWTDGDRDDVARAGLAATIGYPLRLALGMQRTRCGRCDVALDDDMHHLNTCTISVKDTRHDAFVRDMVALGQAIGIDTERHDMKLPFLADGKRPADFVERRPGALDDAIDVTIVLPDRIAAAAEKKHRDYDEVLKGSRYRCVPMAIGLDGTVHAEADDVFQRWRARYSKAMRNAGASANSSAANEVITAVGMAFARRCTRAMRVWDGRLAAELVRGRRPTNNRDRQKSVRGKEHPQHEVAVGKRQRLNPLVNARGGIPEAIRRHSERLETRYDLSNVPIDGRDATAGSAADVCQLVCPLGPNLRAGDAVVGGSIPLLSQQEQLRQ